MSTRTQIYTRAQRLVRTSESFQTFAMDSYNDVVDQMALMAKVRGEWSVTVVSGTGTYDYSSAAVAVPQTPTAVQPLFNGLEFIKLLKTGETAYEDVYIRDRQNWTTEDHVRIFGTKIIFNDTPDYGGTLKLYGFRSIAHWDTDSVAENAKEPDIPDEFHNLISFRIAADYERTYRKDVGMWRHWMDFYESGLRDFGRIMDGDATSQGGFQQETKW